MNLRFQLVFSCDVELPCQKCIQHVHCPEVLFKDITGRDPAEENNVDLHFWTPPCQDFSTAGKQRGVQGKGRLMASSIGYINRQRPASR